MATDVIFPAQTSPTVVLHARAAAPGVLDMYFELTNTNDPSHKTPVEPTGQHGSEASWVVPVSELQACEGGLDNMKLIMTNKSPYTGNVNVYFKASQAGASLKPYGNNGKPVATNDDGEAQVDTLASGASDTVAVALDLS